MNPSLRRAGALSFAFHLAVLLAMVLVLPARLPEPPLEETAVTMEFEGPPTPVQRAQTPAPTPAPAPSPAPTPNPLFDHDDGPASPEMVNEPLVQVSEDLLSEAAASRDDATPPPRRAPVPRAGAAGDPNALRPRTGSTAVPVRRPTPPTAPQNDEKTNIRPVPERPKR